MHKLLLRQLKRYVGPDTPVPEGWNDFIDAVNDTYHQADADRTLLERSMDLTSQELFERNQQLRGNIAERKRIEEIPLHKLLLRQLKRRVGPDIPISEGWRDFIDAVNEAYHQADADRTLLERSMDLTSQELFERNQQLRQDIAERNQMAEALQRARDELERHAANLERRTMQLQVAAEVSRAASSTLDPDELLPQVVELIRERFGLYYAGIFLVDEAGKYAILHAGTGEAGRRMLEADHKLEVGGSSMIGWCAANQRARIALDVGAEAVRFDNPLLPETRSEMALPLISRGEVIGAMTIQSTQEAAFSDEDIAALQNMADQLANAIQNARLFQQAQEGLQRVEEAHRRYLREAWGEYVEQRLEMPGYEYDLGQVTALPEMPPVGPVSALREGHLIIQGEGDGEKGTTLLAPITLRGEPIGVLGFEEPEQPRRWTPDETALIEAVRDQLALALENRRLFEQTQRRAAREQAISQMTARFAHSIDIDTLLQTAVRELGQLPNVIEASVHIGPPEAPVPTTGDDKAGHT